MSSSAIREPEQMTFIMSGIYFDHFIIFVFIYNSHDSARRVAAPEAVSRFRAPCVVPSARVAAASGRGFPGSASAA